MTQFQPQSDSDFFLVKHKVGKPAWRSTRPKPPDLIVIHAAASKNLAVGYSKKELKALDRSDTAERVARFAARPTTKTSWHASTDERDVIWMLPDEYTAFHCRSKNERSLGIELCCQVTDWGKRGNKDWEYLMLETASFVVAHWCRKWDIQPVRLTREECAAGASGLVAHSDADPTIGRKIDVGAKFDWTTFILLIQQRLATPPEREPEPARTLTVDLGDTTEELLTTLTAANKKLKAIREIINS